MMWLSQVYFAGNDRGHVKIGYSVDLQRRLSDIRVGDPSVNLIRIIDGGQRTEEWLHKRFHKYRLLGEWFSFHADMMTICPPDEIPAREKQKPRVWWSLRETLVTFNKYPLMDPDKEPHAFLASLLSSLTDDDARDLIKHLREISKIEGAAQAIKKAPA
jgi:hypothetical protein